MVLNIYYVSYVFPKYGWVTPLKDGNAKTVFHGLVEVINESKCKPNKLWVDQGKTFCNSLMQKLLNDNYILMYPARNEGTPAVVDRFIKTLKRKIYKNDS